MRRVMVCVVLVLAGCGGDSQAAGIMCEQLIEQRTGQALEFASHTGAEREDLGDGRWAVTSSYTDPAGTVVNYRCEVEREGDTWTLVDLTTDR